MCRQPEGNGASGSIGLAISADGRFVAFQSFASTLVAGDTNSRSDIFLRDRLMTKTGRVSVSSGRGVQANNLSLSPAISADGRFIAFSSYASNLVPGDTNGFEDVFVRDRATAKTRRVSVSSGPGVQGNGSSFPSTLSADGRFVAFESFASNLVAGDTNSYEDVFVRDRAMATTRRVSVSSAGVQGNGPSYLPTISADGRFVAFESAAPNLVAGDTNGFDVFVRDRATATTRRVSVSSAGVQENGDGTNASISADGRFVAFESFASNLVAGDTNSTVDVFVRGPLS